jgi:hypothetical protein
MSISRLRKSRGYFIAAAFVLIALLVLAAVAIQSTVPPIITPASQGAQAASADAQVTDIAFKTISAQESTAPVIVGKDQIVLLITGVQPQAIYFPVCPQTPPDQTPKMKAFAQQIQKQFGGKFGMPDGRCKDDLEYLKTPKRQIPINPSAASWPQWTLACYQGISTGAAVSDQLLKTKISDMTDQMVDQAQSVEMLPGIKCEVRAPGTASGGSQGNNGPQLAQLVSGMSDPTQQKNFIAGLNTADQQALNQALSQQTTSLTQTNQQLTATNRQISSQINDLANQPCSSSESCAANQQTISDLKSQQATNQAAIDQNNAQLNNLKNAQVALAGTLPPASTGISNIGNGTGGNGTNQQPAPYYGQSNGNGFSNPSVDANNTPQSPFGGACTSRYVCSGNTLYYQAFGGQMTSYNPIVIQQGQCVTQPVQQCPYGCMAVNGVNGTTGSQSSFLSDFGTGLQLASQILKVFGGGSNNSSVANPNLSSQCAMTPQQSQNPPPSPYGTGTNGQQCYQPPPQPDPAQCTSGTWRPTSANQNGCITGYQCVPTGGGSTGGQAQPTTPSAQLSCQPQIADVGTPISFSFSCGSATASKGTGFDTGGALSGNASIPAPVPPSGTNQASYTLTCINQGVTASALCQVQLNKPGIVLVTNPKTASVGDSSLIGWITAGMQSCVISSPDDQDFTARNAGNSSTNGAATTSQLSSGTTRFQLDCQTLAGASKSATTTVSVQ